MQEKYNEAMPVLEDTVALLETVMHLPVSANDPSACTELSCNCPLLPDFRIRVDIGGIHNRNDSLYHRIAYLRYGKTVYWGGSVDPVIFFGFLKNWKPFDPVRETSWFAVCFRKGEALSASLSFEEIEKEREAELLSFTEK